VAVQALTGASPVVVHVEDAWRPVGLWGR
jgi:hypothetical protein